MNENIIEMKNVSVEYKMRLFSLRAVDRVSLNIKRNCITALVGESGSGKTTLANCILQCLTEPGEMTEGKVLFHGKDGHEASIKEMTDKEIRRFRWSKISMVFQGAQSALNPVTTVKAQFFETMRTHDAKCKKQTMLEKSKQVLKIVNLEPDRVLRMYPHELSGGMKQRVMIAFSLLLDPEMIILDEPTTALDVITQEYIFSILKKINKEMGITMFLLTHDMGIVAKYSDYLGVMYAGKLMEYGDTLTVFRERYHPYTKQLIGATPSLYGEKEDIHSIEGTPPDMLHYPDGCPFHPRCNRCEARCQKKLPDLFEPKRGHFVKCHIYGGETDE